MEIHAMRAVARKVSWLGMLLGVRLWYGFYGTVLESEAAFEGMALGAADGVDVPRSFFRDASLDETRAAIYVV